MENQAKKLRLEDIKVESFVTSAGFNSATITAYGGWSPNDQVWTQTLCNNDCDGGGGAGGGGLGGSVGTCPDGGSCGCTNPNMPCTAGCGSDATWCGSCLNDPCPGGLTNPAQCTQPTNCRC